MAGAELYKQDGDYYQGVNKTSCGYKLMAAMGWQEGEGLGAQKQGIKSHVKVKKKIDNAGVGKSEADARTRDWTLGMMAYEKILTSLTEITSQQQRSAASEEASDASGGGAAPSQSKKGGGKKRARTSTSAASLQGADAADADNSNEAQGAQPSSSSGSDSEVEAPVRKRVTHRGRFKKREASKAVSNYSCEDLTAIIGAASSFPDLTAINAVQRTAPPHDTSDEEAEKGGGNGMDDVDDVHGHTQAPMRHVIQGPPTPPPEEEDQSTAWWRNYFCRSGRLGSARTNTKRVKKVGFSEDDQVALYNLNKDNERCGRQGLGVRGMPPKVAGARWKGTKTKLASDSEADDDDSETHTHAPDAQQEATQPQGVVIILPNGKTLTSTSTTTSTVPADQPDFTENGAARAKVVVAKEPKWRKWTIKVLQEHGGSLKVKALRKRVMAAVGVDGKKHKAAWMEVVEGSSKFVMEGGWVRLASV